MVCVILYGYCTVTLVGRGWSALHCTALLEHGDWRAVIGYPILLCVLMVLSD